MAHTQFHPTARMGCCCPTRLPLGLHQKNHILKTFSAKIYCLILVKFCGCSVPSTDNSKHRLAIRAATWYGCLPPPVFCCWCYCWCWCCWYCRRRVSMATASALEDLAPMQRRDSMARKMTKMFKTPETHTAFLTSSRFALDLIKVCSTAVPRRQVTVFPFQSVCPPKRYSSVISTAISSTSPP